jgi:hypothetical protein
MRPQFVKGGGRVRRWRGLGGGAKRAWGFYDCEPQHVDQGERKREQREKKRGGGRLGLCCVVSCSLWKKSNRKEEGILAN